MQAFAFVTSPICGAEYRLTLKPFMSGAAFFHDETGDVIMGTYTEAANKFEALDKMRGIYGDPGFKLRFELV